MAACVARTCLLLALLLGLPTLSPAQCPGVTTPLTPFASEALTISSTAKPLTTSVYKPSGITPAMATVSVEGGSIRYLLVGTPTDTSGHPMSGSPAQTFTVCGYDSIAAFKAIRVSTDALLTITYFKPR